MTEIKVCKSCVLDSTIPDIIFDEKGVCNYCKLHNTLHNAFPQGEQGSKIMDDIILKITKLQNCQITTCLLVRRAFRRRSIALPDRPCVRLR